MALPQAVERAGQLADQMYEQAYGKQGEPNGAQAPVVAEPSPAPAPAAPAAPPPAEPPAPAQDSWEARYKTLAGKYNAEVPRMAADNRTLKESVGTLTEQVGALTKQIAEQQSKIPMEPLIRPEEIQEFGEPLVDMARRAAKEVVAQAQGPMQRELDATRTELTDLKKSAGEIQWQNFIDLVSSLCPDWAQINVNPDFLSWLDGVDDFTGLPRQSLLDRAKDARDAPRVARFFQTWKQANQNRATDSRNALESQVVPDSSSRTVVPSGKQIYSRAQVKRFYDDWRSGRLTDAQAIVIEAELDAASREGRIR
jgi:hypothetical protein